MDLVADMLHDRLQREHSGAFEASLVRPPFRRRATALPGVRKWSRAMMLDRLANRMWDYPHMMASIAGSFDLFHIVDHSYGQLVHRLPAGRTVVTCHDTDTFRSVLEPELDPRNPAFRAMTRRILDGVRAAGHVACDSEATRAALVEKAGIPEDRTSVVHNGPHPGCSPEPEPSADRDAARLLGPPGASIDLLHVGSPIPRKRIDLLLRVFAAVRRYVPLARLVRAGGPLTGSQRALARDLGVAGEVLTLPVLDRSTLAAVYRRSALLLLPSEREGFGLPILEALASGTPVVASDIDVFREVGGFAISYCAIDDVEAWRSTVVRLLGEREHSPAQWSLRREAGSRRAAAFSWSHYGRQVACIYQRIAAGERAC
ncbi:MAG TPA: glycosyltransferase family 1 protein, partial [Vicinamibacterales bacterium]|nr:glycosyltransferase family 1 protein [Vicinamibacterales bacterium]